MKPIKLSIVLVIFTLVNIIMGHAALTYTTSWVGNTYGDNAHHVGNCERSMWVDTNGMIYTASLWDENAGGIVLYQNGQTLGSIGAHNEMQGSCITGNKTSVFAAMQGSTFGGYVGRYNRSTKARDLVFQVSASAGDGGTDTVTGIGVSPFNGLLYASDSSGNRVRVFDTNGVWQQDWTVSNPGALAVDSAGNVWVAQMTNGTIQEFNAIGGAMKTITMASTSRPSALYFDTSNAQLMVGDEGPDQNIKIYDNLEGTPTLVGTFGVTGGYLSTAGGAIKGTTGDKRFTRVVGIGKDNAGHLYVLQNCWGGNWDLGRNGATDIHCYDSAGTLLWTLQALNFEGNGAVDTASDGDTVYNANVIMSGTGQAGYVANTVDPFTYPADWRVNITPSWRGFHFAMLSTVSSNRILIACSQNPDKFYSYYFNTANGYIGIPGIIWGQTNAERKGFCLDSAGNVWEGQNNTGAIRFNRLTGFDFNGAPIYAAATSTPIPNTISPLGRIIYLPESDAMILAQAVSSDWTTLGSRVEVYKGWRAGNTNTPNTVITLNTNLNPKAIAAAGNYLFVGYVHTVPNIDVYNITTGTLEITMTNANPSVVYVGNDIDSMYGLSAYQKANGNYIITKDNYNANSVIVHTMITGTPPAPTGLTATAGDAQVNLAWAASSGASSYNVKRATVSGGPYITIANPTNASYTDTTSINGTTYFYVVSAVNSGGESANSSVVSAVPISPPPTAPSGLAAVGGSLVVNLNWTQSTTQGINGNNVYRSNTGSGGPYNLLANLVASTSYADTAVTGGNNYFYSVTAVSSSGESAMSAYAGATTIPSAPTGLAATGDDNQVALSWTASTGATSYDVKRATVNGGPYTTIANGLATTSYTDNTPVNGTTYYYVVSALNTSGESANSTESGATPTLSNGALPSPWQALDVGNVGVVGSATHTNGMFTVTGSGSDIWSAADSFRYVEQTGGTNCMIQVKVLTVQNTQAHAKGGVMIRETLNTNSTMAMVDITPSAGVEFIWRTATGGSAAGKVVTGVVPPTWVKVTRNGNTFVGYYSTNGASWTAMATNTIAMANSVYIGLPVCAHNNTTTSTATFTNVVAMP